MGRIRSGQSGINIGPLMNPPVRQRGIRSVMSSSK